MAKLSRDQMRFYQRARRKRLRQGGGKDLKQPLAPGDPALVTLGKHEERLGILEDAVTALQAAVALQEVVNETVAEMGPPYAADKTLFRRVVAEKEKRLGG